jgi:hypothetical protein
MKLTIKPSHKADKKFDAVFEGEGVHRTIPFGAKGYMDYTKGASEEKRAAYIKRHQVNENFNDMYSRAALSRYILWGGSRSMHTNIQEFKKKFHII